MNFSFFSFLSKFLWLVPNSSKSNSFKFFNFGRSSGNSATQIPTFHQLSKWMTTPTPENVQAKMNSAQLWCRNGKFQSEVDSKSCESRFCLSEICHWPHLCSCLPGRQLTTSARMQVRLGHMSIMHQSCHIINQYPKFNRHVFV